MHDLGWTLFLGITGAAALLVVLSTFGGALRAHSVMIDTYETRLRDSRRLGSGTGAAAPLTDGENVPVVGPATNDIDFSGRP